MLSPYRAYSRISCFISRFAKIIRVRLVCREFNRVVSESGLIKRALFTAPSSANTVEWYGAKGGEARDGQWRVNEDAEPEFLILNPFTATTAEIQLFQSQKRAPNAIYLMRHCLWFTNPLLQSAQLLKLDQKAPRWGLGIASSYIKNMQLSQPPLRKLILADKDAKPQLVGTEKTGFKLVNFSGTPLNLIVARKQLKVVGGHRFVVLCKTVDEISGHEMLEILKLGYEGRAKFV